MFNDKKISNLEDELYHLKKKVDFIADKLGFEGDESGPGLLPLFMSTYYEFKLTKWDKLLKYLGLEWKNETKTIQEFKKIK